MKSPAMTFAEDIPNQLPFLTVRNISYVAFLLSFFAIVVIYFTFQQLRVFHFLIRRQRQDTLHHQKIYILHYRTYTAECRNIRIGFGVPPRLVVCVEFFLWNVKIKLK